MTEKDEKEKIKAKRQSSLHMIKEVEEDIKALQKNLKEYKKIIKSIETKDDIKKLEDFDPEKGLKHIELW